MPTTDESKLFDRELDDTLDRPLDDLREENFKNTDKLEQATDKLTREQRKSEPSENLMEKLSRAWDATKQKLEESQQAILDWFAEQDQIDAARWRHQEELDRMAGSMPTKTRAQRLARMRKWAEGLTDAQIIENMRQMGTGPGAADARRAYEEELRKRHPVPNPRPGPPPTGRRPAQHKTGSKRKPAVIARYRSHRWDAKTMSGPQLIERYFAICDEGAGGDVAEVVALRNEWRSRARRLRKQA